MSKASPALRLAMAASAVLGCDTPPPAAPEPTHAIFSVERLGPGTAATYRLRVKLAAPPRDLAHLQALADTVSQSVAQRPPACAYRILFYSSAAADTAVRPDIGWADWGPRTLRPRARCDTTRNAWNVELFDPPA